MKNEISFMSGMFVSPGRIPAQPSDTHFGGDLAAWFITKSTGSEFVFSNPTELPGGWSETVTADGESFVLGFGLGAPSADADYAEWVITIDKTRRLGVFGSKDSPSRSRLCDHIHNILRDERGVREVQWGQ